MRVGLLRMERLESLKSNSIKRFGERHTGTNALNVFIRENFDLTVK